MNDYGTALRNAREKRSITQTELARRSGISRREISDIERGFTASPDLSQWNPLLTPSVLR